ncbi:glutaredoxin [Colwellia sp. UCD-KL20]|uniref:glutaredoxin family protein n=1 Tax=Colwellia sp. UCD-KL20 TaxID=1917165 RepID=UPI0009702D7A|nr:glutaredoxin [Colwellia sp. UCD-KL20]
MKKNTFALYKMSHCPYCIKTIKAIKNLKIDVEYKDINESEKHNKTLIQEGGKRQVPCLRIPNENGAPTWLYESGDIINFLTKLSVN